MRIKSSNFVSETKDQETLVRTHLFTIPKDQGTVFAVIRFLGKNNQARTRIADVIEERLQGLEQTLTESGNIARRFEQFLQALNQDIANIAAQERLIPLSDTHIVLGVLQGHQLFVSGIGNLHALFMNRTAKQRYVIYELDKQLQTQEETSWDKLFITVLDGELHPGDIFYMANRVSAREISLAELQDILVTLPPSGALKRISQHLNPKTAYGSVCLQIVEPPTGGPPKKVNPITSVEQLGKTKEQTEQLLGEQEPDVGRTIQRLTRPLLRILSSPGTKGTRSTFKRVLHLLVRGLTILITYIIKLISWTFKGLWQIITNLPQVFSRGRAFVKQEPTPKQRAKNIVEKFNTLSRPTKIASLGFIAVLAVTVVSVRVLNSYQTRQAEQEAQTTILTSIEDKQTEAQARLIYDDDAEARQLIEEAFALLETLPNSTDEDVIQTLREDLQNVLLSIQGIESVTITTIATLSDDQSDAELLDLFTLGDTVYTLSTAQSLYSLSELTESFTDSTLTPGAIGVPLLSGIETETTFLTVDENQQLGRGSIEGGALTPIVSGINDLASVEDLITYNEALYVLTADGDQIVKMRARGDGYEAGTAWVTSSTSSLTNARAITIDGDLYVLTTDRILKYRSGHEQGFSHETIDPDLSNPLAIWTDTESSYLYILDPGESRVIVMDKDGDLVTQYNADELSDAVGMIVQEDQRRILIATKGAIFSFSTTHLLQ
jgi:hypothetical protein